MLASSLVNPVESDLPMFGTDSLLGRLLEVTTPSMLAGPRAQPVSWRCGSMLTYCDGVVPAVRWSLSLDPNCGRFGFELFRYTYKNVDQLVLPKTYNGPSNAVKSASCLVMNQSSPRGFLICLLDYHWIVHGPI